MLGNADVIGVVVIVWFGNRYAHVVEPLVELPVTLRFVERNPGSPDAAMPEPNIQHAYPGVVPVPGEPCVVGERLLLDLDREAGAVNEDDGDIPLCQGRVGHAVVREI